LTYFIDLRNYLSSYLIGYLSTCHLLSSFLFSWFPKYLITWLFTYIQLLWRFIFDDILILLANISLGLNHIQWFYLNSNKTGFYIVNYDDRNWQSLLKALSEHPEVSIEIFHHYRHCVIFHTKIIFRIFPIKTGLVFWAMLSAWSLLESWHLGHCLGIWKKSWAKNRVGVFGVLFVANWSIFKCSLSTRSFTILIKLGIYRFSYYLVDTIIYFI